MMQAAYNFTPKHKDMPFLYAASKLRAIIDASAGLKELVSKSIEQAKEMNHDKSTNPVQSVDELIDFVKWGEWTLPKFLIESHPRDPIYDSLDQSIDYLYWLLDQPLDELKGSGFYSPSVQYVKEIAGWLKQYALAWGHSLSMAESWTPAMLEALKRDPLFGPKLKDYEDPSKWQSFNMFFSRALASPGCRPIYGRDDCRMVASPVDGCVQGQWHIGQDGQVEGLTVKSKKFGNVCDLLADPSAGPQFYGGELTHLFLDIDDYHRFHFPVGGEVISQKEVPGGFFGGGTYLYDKESKRYWLDSREPGWESIETRAVTILETGELGVVACVPVGMSQIASISLSRRQGDYVSKGDEMGWFSFGGSDFVIIFQKQAKFKLSVGAGQHLLMGELLGTCSLEA